MGGMLRAVLIVAILISLCAIAVSIGVGRTHASERFAAEPHRESIRAIESELYRSTPPESGDEELVADALIRLAEALAPPGADFAARQHARRLHDLAGMASGMGDAGYTLPDLGLLRGEWERQRDELFIPAPWFGHSNTALAAAQTRRSAVVDPMQVTRLRHTVRRLETLAESGEAEVRELGEPEYDLEAPSASGRAQIARWNAWARRWDARLDDALRELPPPPPLDAELALVLAHQNTSRAANELRLVPQGAGDWPTPFRHQWESRFSAARQLLAERRGSLVLSPD